MGYRIVFLGTPQAAIPTLELLNDHHDVTLVVTQPDRPKGRSGRPSPPPVKEFATRHGLTVSQPENRTELAEALSSSAPFDVGVVVAYGRILSSEILKTPEHGLLNVHFSLLPRWRGAAPVARALMAGDTMTGVTIIQLDEGLDTGPVLTAQAVDILDDENAGDLTGRLASLGAHLLLDVLSDYLRGEITPVAQVDDGVTYAEKIEAVDRVIDPDSNSHEVVSKVRALAPSPAATLQIDGEPHKIYAAKVVDSHLEPGTWVTVEGRPLVGFPDGAVELLRLQTPGRRPQEGADWVRGRDSDGGVIG